MDLVGNDVVFRAAVDRADGDDGGVGRLDLAADDGLEVENQEGGQDDGVDGEMRSRAMAALAVDEDIDRGGGSQGGSGGVGDLAGLEVVGDVQGQGVVGLAESGRRGRRRASSERHRSFPRRAGR